MKVHPLPTSLWLCVPTTFSHCQPHPAPRPPGLLTNSNLEWGVPWAAGSGGPSPHSVSIFTRLPRISPGSQDKWRCGQGEKEKEGRERGRRGHLAAAGALTAVSCPRPCPVSPRVCWVFGWVAVRVCECVAGTSCLSVSQISVCLLLCVCNRLSAWCVCGSGYVCWRGGSVNVCV